MSTTYPGTIQTFTDPSGTSLLTSPDHAGLHTDINDTVEALETYAEVKGTLNFGTNTYALGTGLATNDYLKYNGTSIIGNTAVGLSDTQTLTNKRITRRTGGTTSSATPTINTDNVDFYSITAQGEAITSMTTNLSGTPTQNQTLWIAITGTAAEGITWGTAFEAGAAALPTTTVTTQRLDVAFTWNTVTGKWRCMAAGPTS